MLKKKKKNLPKNRYTVKGRTPVFTLFFSEGSKILYNSPPLFL
jgi:hypothetical protein